MAKKAMKPKGKAKKMAAAIPMDKMPGKGKGKAMLMKRLEGKPV